MFSTFIKKYIIAMVLFTAIANAAEILKVDFDLGSPTSNWYTTGWLKLSESPQPISTLHISYDLNSGCDLITQPQALVSNGTAVSRVLVDRGNIYVGANIQYLSFEYANRDTGPSCRIHISGHSAGGVIPHPIWSSEQATRLAQRARGDALSLSTWMNILKIQGLANYNAIDAEKRTLLNELEQLETLISTISSKAAARSLFSVSKRAFFDFRRVFLPVHTQQAEPQKVENSWIQFQKSFFELDGFLSAEN